MDWFQVVPEARVIGQPPVVEDVTHDSRRVRPGLAFVAVPGSHVDGHEYIGAAVRAGAAAVVVQEDREAKWVSYVGRTALVVVPDTRAAMGHIAATVHGNPSHYLRLIGVTGTDGKTTTCHLAAHVLSQCGLDCGYLTSAGFDTGAGFEANAAHMTTLESTAIQSMLADAIARGRRSMLVEASSEGLAQHRLNGCEFDVGVFRNLTRDHLDFHGTMEAYRNAKGRLFEMLGETTGKPFPNAAILNADEPASDYYRSLTSVPILTYGIENAADLRAVDIEVRPEGFAFSLVAGERRVAARSPLLGHVYNCLAAVSIALSQDVDLATAAAALASFPGIPGRLEAIDAGQPFRVFVDIASTPAALENVLGLLRPITTGRLWVVFGAAGGRDPARRGGMGEVAARLANRAILTNEDPRDDDPDAIIDAIAQALLAAGRVEGRDFVRRPDRREAIRHAFANAAAGDTVLLAGKATETFMVFVNGEQRPWDERAVAREILGVTVDG